MRRVLLKGGMEFLCCSDADTQPSLGRNSCGCATVTQATSPCQPTTSPGQIGASGIGSPTSLCVWSISVSDAVWVCITELEAVCAPLVPQCSADSKV